MEVRFDDKNFDCFGILADEIIIQILSDSTLRFSDVCRVGQTCKRLQGISQDQHIWMTKLLQAFPDVKDLVAEHSETDATWQQKCMQLNGVPSATTTLLQALQKRPRDAEEVDYKCFEPLDSICKDSMCHRVMEQLLRKFDSDNENVNKNLTLRWYSKKALRCINHSVLKPAWDQFFLLPSEKQHLEDGAILLARWFQPDLDLRTSDIKQQLDKIADMVWQELGNHPAARKFDHDTEHPALTQDQSIQLLKVMNKVLYIKLGFCGNVQEYYDENNSNINKVLESKLGIPITLSILYQSIARRLGIILHPVNFPGHFLLVLDTSSFGYSEQKIYIDAFHNGRQKTQRECCQLVGLDSIQQEYFNPASAKDVFIRMANNCIRQAQEYSDDSRMLTMLSAVELLVQINPWPRGQDALVMLTKLYVHLQFNAELVVRDLGWINTSNMYQDAYTTRLCFLKTHAEETYREQQREDRKEEFPEKKRDNNPEVKYSVGLVMRHRRYNYNCVIYGWDAKCDHTNEWKQQMGVYQLPNKDKQPFYNVFVADGTNRYAAEESLKYIDEPEAIPHKDVGRCFDEFNGHYYVMNEGTKLKYSDDEQLTKTKYEEQYGKITDCGAEGTSV